MKVICAFLLALVAFCTQAYAQESESDEDAVEYDFDEDVIDGSTKSPEELYINSLRKSKLKSLITIRKNFKEEIVKSAEGI
jgi:hypothetical protein